MEYTDLIPHLFRTEYRKIVSVLCHHFGINEIELAEDIASETFLTASQVWPMKGVPVQPEAWLYHVAKNKAKNALRRRSNFINKVLPAATAGSIETEIDLSEESIEDSQLRMLFAVCHPVLPVEMQIALALRVLCGFGIDEIADAFLSNRETITKRLYRAKERIRQERIEIVFPDENELHKRIDAVLKTIYLLFNEGYYSISSNEPLRKDLCLEAMRLCHMLLPHSGTYRSRTCALLALMCFHASRFDARVGGHGEIVLYEDQDVARWNRDLIARGANYLHEASIGKDLSTYHVEAAIAAWHTQKHDAAARWDNILQLYNHLLQLSYSPMAALNRTYAYAKVHGHLKALEEARKLRLEGNQFYHMLLGVLYEDIDRKLSLENFEMAFAHARAEADRQLIQLRINRIGAVN